MGAGVVVKMVSNKGIYVDYHALRLFPDGVPVYGGVRFVFDDGDEPYDWLVVYHDLPAHTSTLRPQCPRENTIFVTHEPSAVKTYGNDFCAQFGWVLSCHEGWSLAHPRCIHTHPGSTWIYGADFYDKSYRGLYNYNDIKAITDIPKTRTISTVCSDKKMKHTFHYHRYHWTQRLKRAVPELDLFGHGVNLIRQKADALDAYKYHVAIENHIAPHYWTEKLSDAFLGFTVPLYCGCPNAADYFPKNSFIPIDIRKPDTAIDTIRSAIRNNEYESRLADIKEARRRVLEEHNLYAMLARTISTLPRANNHAECVLHSRYGLMLRKPHLAVKYAIEKLVNRWRIIKINR